MNSKRVGLGILDTIIRVVIIIVAAMLITKYAKVAYNFGYNIFYQVPVTTSGEGKTVRITIDDTVTVTELAKQLEEVGIIQDWKLFYVQERFSNYHGKIVGGTYELSSTMTADELLEVLTANYTESDDTESTDGDT